jgi:hypothetical protein
VPQRIGFSHVNLTMTDVQARKRFRAEAMGSVLAMEVGEFSLFVDPASLTAIGARITTAPLRAPSTSGARGSTTWRSRCPTLASSPLGWNTSGDTTSSAPRSRSPTSATT